MRVIAQNDDSTVSAVYDFFLRLTNVDWLAAIADRVAVPLLRIVGILVVAYLVNRVLRRAIKRSVRRLAAEGGLSRLGALKQRTPLADTTAMDIGRLTMRAETIAGVLRSIATVVIWSIAAIMVLAEFGVNLGPLIAGAGIIGVALGFGSQKLVQDFLAGIFMLMEDQYGLGDIVDAGDAVGEIEGITLRTTRIRDLEGTVWHIPNGQITRIGNKSQEWARALLDIGVAYETDLPTAMAILKRAADELWQDPAWAGYVIEEPEVWGVNEFGASEVVIRMVLKTLPGEQWKVSRELRKRIKAVFDAEGIEIPFPQRTLWVHERTADGSGEAALWPGGETIESRHRAGPEAQGAGSELPGNG